MLPDSVDVVNMALDVVTAELAEKDRTSQEFDGLVARLDMVNDVAQAARNRDYGGVKRIFVVALGKIPKSVHSAIEKGRFMPYGNEITNSRLVNAAQTYANTK